MRTARASAAHFLFCGHCSPAASDDWGVSISAIWGRPSGGQAHRILRSRTSGKNHQGRPWVEHFGLAEHIDTHQAGDVPIEGVVGPGTAGGGASARRAMPPAQRSESSTRPPRSPGTSAWPPQRPSEYHGSAVQTGTSKVQALLLNARPDLCSCRASVLQPPSILYAAPGRLAEVARPSGSGRTDAANGQMSSKRKPGQVTPYADTVIAPRPLASATMRAAS